MADADPTVVGSEVGNGDAAQVGADCRADQDLSISCRVDADLAGLVEEGRLGEFVLLLVHLCSGQSSDENGSAVPDNLEDLSWRNFGNIDFEIGISVVASPPVEPADDGESVETTHVCESGVEDCAEHVDLGSSNVGFVLVVDSVLVEPVVDVGLEVDVVSEVSGSGRGDKEAVFVGD